MYTFEQVRCFVAVAEELHFGRAAARLNMTQPPLSRQIQKLEKAIGVSLLDRDNRHVQLTMAGDVFLTECRRLLVAADGAPALARRIAAGRAGMIRLGFTAATGFSLLGTLVQQIGELLPDVDLDLQELVTSEQIESIRRGELDLALGRLPFDPAEFDSRLLLSEDLVLVVPDGHPLAALHRPVRTPDLRDVPLIGHDPIKARYFYDMVVRYVDVEHVNVVHVVSQILTMCSLVGAGRGVAFVPESVRRLDPPGVSFVGLADVPDGIVELHAIWDRSSRNPALHELLRSLGSASRPRGTASDRTTMPD
ncbi:LysR substrate-binding domain-containing protein [Isoptericola sp. NPDC056134]|uniref:LysR substrate-binding domain-containing protein n=1 Tax=unclassified Isoptericola TaxID=2623355 RepID=UPI0035ED8100